MKPGDLVYVETRWQGLGEILTRCTSHWCVKMLLGDMPDTPQHKICVDEEDLRLAITEPTDGAA